MKEKVFSVSIHDCEVQTFSAGGKGGQNQNRRSTGVRIIHHPSGARAECREERSQLQNKKKAWRRLVDSHRFKYWLGLQLKNIESDETYLARTMVDENILVETRKNGRWERA